MAATRREGVIFERVEVGAYAKLSAIDTATGVEVSVVGPRRASDADLRRLALNKLKRALDRDVT